MITVACVWVDGHVPYPQVYVERLASMVRRHLTVPSRLVCLTDRPWRIPADQWQTIPIPNPKPMKAWWSKIELFNPAHDLGTRVLYLDLDSLVVDSLDPLALYPTSFALVPHAGTFSGKGRFKIVKRYNSSVMVWDVGTTSGLYTGWTPEVADRLHGDQDWIGEQRNNAETMPLEWFPRLSELNGNGIPHTARVVLCKTPKNEEAAQKWPWFREQWQ